MRGSSSSGRTWWPRRSSPITRWGSHVAPRWACGSRRTTRCRRSITAARSWPGGSWDRTPLSGYAVVYVPFQQGMPSGPPQTVVSGFHSRREAALWRTGGSGAGRQRRTADRRRRGRYGVAGDLGALMTRRWGCRLWPIRPWRRFSPVKPIAAMAAPTKQGQRKWAGWGRLSSKKTATAARRALLYVGAAMAAMGLYWKMLGPR